MWRFKSLTTAGIEFKAVSMGGKGSLERLEKVLNQFALEEYRNL